MNKHFCFALLLIFSVVSACSPVEKADAVSTTVKTTATAMITPDSLLRHVVMFQWKADSPAEKIKEIENAFSALPSKISEIADYEWGINNSPEGLNQGLTHCFLVTFKSEADRAAYLPHEDHQAFVKLIGPYVEGVTVLDYWTK